MKIRMELAPDEPVVVTVNIPDREMTPELRKKIEELSDQVPFDPLDLPADVEAGIDWDEVINTYWVVNKIKIKEG